MLFILRVYQGVVMRIFLLFSLFILSFINSCKKAEGYKIGSLGELRDFEVEITNAIQPKSNLPILSLTSQGGYYIYYVDSSGNVRLKSQNKDLKLSTEELRDATLGGLKLIEDEKNIYAFYWARYAKGDIYKQSEEDIKKRRERFQDELKKRQDELKALAEEKKRILRETPEERKKKEELKRELEKIKAKYPDLKSEDLTKRREAYKQYIREASEKRKAILGDIERARKEKIEALRRKEMELRSQIKSIEERNVVKTLAKNIFMAVIEKGSFTLKGIHKITPDRFFPTADIGIGSKDGLTLLAWTDEKVEGSIGVCYTLSRDMLNWSEPECLKGYINPGVVDKGDKLFLHVKKCDREQCEYKFLVPLQDKLKELSTLKTPQSELYIEISYSGKEYHIYTWGPESYSLYHSKDLSQFEKIADSSEMKDKMISMLLPVSTESPKAVLILKPKNPKNWLGINLDKPNIYLAEFSDGKIKLTRLQRNTEHLTTATNPAVGVNSKGDIIVVWIDKRFLIPIPFATFITRDGNIYRDNPLEDPRLYTVDQPSIISTGEEFLVYYPIKKVETEKETAKLVYSKPYFSRLRKLKVSPIEYVFDVPSKDSLEKAFKDYAKARIEGNNKKAYQYFDPVFRLRLTYDQWVNQKVDVKFKDIKLKDVEVSDNFGQVVYQAQVEFPEQIGKVVVTERERKYESIDEVWIYLFGNWYYVPRTPISSIFYAEW